MRGLVAFRAGGAEWAVAVEQAREVRPAAGLSTLPAPAAGVVGVLGHGGAALTVLSVLAADAPADRGPAGQVLVLEAGGRSFGLLVDEVTGVRQVAESDLGPPPAGQHRPFVAGVVNPPDGGGAMTFVLDAAVLARLLEDPPGPR